MLRSGHAWRCVWPTIYKSSCQNSYQLWLRDAGEKPHSKPRYTLHTQHHHQLGIENTIQKSRVETWSRNLWEREVFCWHHPCSNNQKHQFICLYNHPVLNLFTKHSVITWHNATLLCGSGGELHTDGNDSEGSGSVGTPDSGHTHLSQLSLLSLLQTAAPHIASLLDMAIHILHILHNCQEGLT